jgi:aspartate/tyrosine/aromatic aminotransferase
MTTVGPKMLRWVETEETHHALKGCADILDHRWKKEVYITLPTWRNFMATWVRKGTQGTVRQFDEEGLDRDCIKMRMLAIWEAEEATRSGEESWNNPEVLLLA